MIIINTTFVIEETIETEVLKWIVNSYCASAINAGALSQNTFLAKVLVDNDQATSYALHIVFDDIKAADDWEERDGAMLRSQLMEKWGERALSFATYLEPISMQPWRK